LQQVFDVTWKILKDKMPLTDPCLEEEVRTILAKTLVSLVSSGIADPANLTASALEVLREARIVDGVQIPAALQRSLR
jgi:hypothetical protein